MVRILIVTGEASGDLHGSLVTRAIRRRRPDAEILAVGSTRLREAGARIIADPTEFAAMGFLDAALHLPKYAALFRRILAVVRAERPDAVVLIDFPDFNFRLAPHLHERRIPIVYYIPPQAWAWRPGRVKAMARWASRVLVIFPFEEEFYRRAGVPAEFVGNPLVELLDGHPPAPDLRPPGGVPLVGLLPGSRRKQYQALLPRLAEAARILARSNGDLRFVIAEAPTVDPTWSLNLRRSHAPELPAVRDRTYDVMATSDILITASGTATLEAAILGTPMVVTYWVNPLVALAVAPLLKVRDYALVNLIAGRRVVPELYQFQAKPKLLADAAAAILRDGNGARMRRELSEVRAKLGPPGATDRVARRILELVP